MEEQPVVNNPIQQPIIPTPPEPKHSSFLTSKLFLITLTIAVLFTAVYAGIYLYLGSQLDQITKSNPLPTTISQPSLTPTIDPIANWKTYSNEDLTFSLRYPPNWTVKESAEDSGFPVKFKVVLLKPNVQVQNKDWGLVAIKVAENSKNMILNDFINYLLCDDAAAVDNRCLEGEYGTKISIAGVSARKLNPPGPIPSQVVVAIENNKIFIISMGLDKSLENLYSIEQKEKIFDQILSTFKFTDQKNQVVCALDAKLCPDGSYVSRQPPTCEFAKCP